MGEQVLAIDAWVNPNTPECARVWHDQRFPNQVRTEVFLESTQTIAQGCSIEATIGDMRAAGIERGVLSGMYSYSPWEDVEQFMEFLAAQCRAHPDAFIASGGLDPRTNYPGVKLLERMVRELDFRAFRVMPTLVGLPPDDAAYYPFYVKCIELGIPVTVNIGFPGPREDVTLQHPLHLDRVLRDFPELTLVGTHVGFPWQLEVIALLTRHPNFFLMTSAFAPKHYPREYLDFMNTRGAEKVMFATDYPLLPFERCVREALELPLEPDVMRRFLRDNALSVFRWD